MNEKELIGFFKERREDFPILKQKIKGYDLVYADNGASTQKPKEVIDAVREVYESYYSNIHRGVHTLSESATEKYEDVRDKVADFINCSREEVIFTKGTTHGLNTTVFGLKDLLDEGDEIVLSQMEHHANLVPWQQLAKEKNLALRYVGFNSDFLINMDEVRSVINSKTRIVSMPHVSNVLGTVNDVKEIARIAHNVGALMVVDGAQSVPHMRVDVKDLDCDLLSFSSHKMCGPSGVGVLYGKKDVLEKMKPFEYGGDMIYEVSYESSSFNKIPYRFEAGTPNIEGVIGFGAAIDYLSSIGMKNIEEYEKILTQYFLKRVKSLEDITIYGPTDVVCRSGVFSFSISSVHPHDVSAIMDQRGIAIRGGHHCAMPLANKLGVCATSRISLYFYNTLEDIDYIIDVLSNLKEVFKKGDFSF